MTESRRIQVKVQRYDPATGSAQHHETFDVRFDEGFNVTSILYRILEEHDGSVAYRVSCHRGLCASCLMRINGKPKLACCELVEGDLVLEPAFKDLRRVIKDLVVEQDRRIADEKETGLSPGSG
jgi:succinate dehydrogenase / fumarate reductase iron-sulfur subunit